MDFEKDEPNQESGDATDTFDEMMHRWGITTPDDDLKTESPIPEEQEIKRRWSLKATIIRREEP